MGMFDYVRCEYPLPGICDPVSMEFQTKDTPCEMHSYTITKAGRLVHHDYELEATPESEMPYYGKPEWEKGGLYRLLGCLRTKPGSERDVDTNWHGYFTFYDYKDGEWIQFCAKFTEGTIVSVEREAGDEL